MLGVLDLELQGVNGDLDVANVKRVVGLASRLEVNLAGNAFAANEDVNTEAIRYQQMQKKTTSRITHRPESDILGKPDFFL